MKKMLSGVLPFLAMFVLVTGSVVLSCATGSFRDDRLVSLKAEVTPEGKILTLWVLSEIQSVIVVDGSNRSRKIELTPDEWRYDGEEGVLTLRKDVPFETSYAVVQGCPSAPPTFILTNIGNYDDLLVILDNRLAIEGYDYTVDRDSDRLMFREGVNLNREEWFIRYPGEEGTVSLGEGKPENRDKIAYLEAEHQKRFLDSWYDKQEAFWFLEEGDGRGKPQLVRRAATDGERRDMKSFPLSVWKVRSDARLSELSREMGFSLSLPEEIAVKESIPFLMTGKTIEETFSEGKLVRKLHISYENGENSVDLVLVSRGEVEPEAPERVIDDRIIDLGRPVRRVRQWGLVSQGMGEKPEVGSYTSWTWSQGDVRYFIGCESDEEELYRSIISRILKKG